MRKFIAGIALVLMLAPVQSFGYFTFEGESPVFTKADQDFLREMMKIQKQSGDIIRNIGDSWGVSSPEIESLSTLSSQLSMAIRGMSGIEKKYGKVCAPGFSKERAALLKKAAKLQVEADSIILKMIDQKSVDQLRFERLRDTMAEVADILSALEN